MCVPLEATLSSKGIDWGPLNICPISIQPESATLLKGGGSSSTRPLAFSSIVSCFGARADDGVVNTIQVYVMLLGRSDERDRAFTQATLDGHSRHSSIESKRHRVRRAG